MPDRTPLVAPGRYRIVVIGASAGGVSTLRRLVSALPPDLPAIILVVLHIGAHPSVLPDLLAASGSLPAEHAQDGAPLRPGRIQVAPPDHHLLVQPDSLQVIRGPKEHHSRPAIDPLFRSAALAHGPAVIGVVLTGYLDDGTAGLQAIKARGGIAIVQDPTEAQEPSMPMSALRHVEVDHCLPIDEIARTLISLVAEPLPSPSEPLDDSGSSDALAHEQALILPISAGDAMDHLEKFAQPSTLVCPDCGGALWEVSRAHPGRFRCHTGHGFSMRSLAFSMNEATELAMETAIRSMHEQALLLRKAADAQLELGRPDEAATLEAAARQAESHALTLRAMVEKPPLQALQSRPASEV